MTKEDTKRLLLKSRSELGTSKLVGFIVFTVV